MPLNVFQLGRESIQEIRRDRITITEFENGSEQRALKNSKPVIGFKVRSKVSNYAQIQAYRSFYSTQNGELTEFEFTSPFDGVTYVVRFDGEISTEFRAGTFQADFSFKVVYD